MIKFRDGLCVIKWWIVEYDIGFHFPLKLSNFSDDELLTIDNLCESSFKLFLKCIRVNL